MRLREAVLFFAFAYVLIYTVPELWRFATSTASAVTMWVCGIEAPDPAATPSSDAQDELRARVAANPVLHALDYAEQGYEYYKSRWDDAVVAFNERVLAGKYTIDKRPLGSGDTQWNYIEIAWMASLASVFAVIALIASLILPSDRRHRFIGGVLVFVARWYLVMHMLGYGFAKVIPTQFMGPRLADLLTTYGDMSPMGLVWRFMGFSTAYCIFCGAGEVLGGILLVFRKTTTLGAFVVIAVMSNVVMINFCFDVPVKLFSSHLLALAIGLLCRDLSRFLDFFVFNRPTAPRILAPFCGSATIDVLATGAKLLLVCYMSYEQVRQNHGFYLQRLERSPLYGVYDVVSFQATALDPTAVGVAPVGWNLVIFESPTVFFVKKVDQASRYFGFELDPANRSMKLIPDFRNRDAKADWSYDDVTDPGNLILTGDLEGHRVTATLKRRDARFFLVDRGFNWVNEVPLNR